MSETILPLSLLLSLTRATVFISTFSALRGEFRVTGFSVGVAVGLGFWLQMPYRTELMSASGSGAISGAAAPSVSIAPLIESKEKLTTPVKPMALPKAAFAALPPGTSRSATSRLTKPTLPLESITKETRSTESPLSVCSIFLLLFREAFIGVVVAAPFVCVMEFLGSAGRLGDLYRGLLDAELTLPNLEQRVSPLESLIRVGIMAWVLAVGAHHRALELLFSFYVSDPQLSGGETNSFVDFLALSLVIAGKAFTIVVSIALPVLASVTLFYLAIFAVSKLVPRLCLVQESRTMVLLLGLAVVTVVFSVFNFADLSWSMFGTQWDESTRTEQSTFKP